MINKEIQKEISGKIPSLIGELNKRLIERDELSRLVVLAICSHNHMFLIGERGVAKSMTVELVNDVIEDARFWQLQVGEDTKVEELFGEKRSNEKGEMHYVSQSSVLNSHLVVLDEMFKARGEVLNAMLEILVEGAYTSGDGKKRKTPMISTFGTSNEYPTETKMLPYVDRFLFWYEVERIKDVFNRKKFYAGDYEKSKIKEIFFTLDDMDIIRQESKMITVPDEVISLYETITSAFIVQSVKTSDRKYDKTLNSVMKTSAYLNNRGSVDVSDVFLLLHTSWHDAFEKEKVYKVVFDKIFGASDEIKNEVISITKDMEEVDTYKNANLFDFLNYRVDIQGNNKDGFYKKILENVSAVWNAYKELRNRAYYLIEKYNYNIKVEKLLENNLFLYSYKQKAFDKNILFQINQLIKKLDEKISYIEEWYQESDALFKYQARRSKKGKKNEK